MDEQTNPFDPFSLFNALPAPLYRTPASLREEIETLKQIIAFQDIQIADLQRFLGLRGEVGSLEDRLNERMGKNES